MNANKKSLAISPLPQQAHLRTMQPRAPAEQCRKTKLTDHQLIVVLTTLQAKFTDSALPRNAIAEIARRVSVRAATGSRVWRRAQEMLAATGVFESKPGKHQCSRRKHDVSDALERLHDVPLQSRSTLRPAAAMTNLPTATLFRRLQDCSVCVVTSVVKMSLTSADTAQRLTWCCDYVDQATLHFRDMWEDVLFVTEAHKRFVALPDEHPPARTLRSKQHIMKGMMLAAVARPRWDASPGTYFDGRLGIWPFLSYESARRSSFNRPAGTLVPCDVPVNKETYRSMLLERLFPAIAARWPGNRCVIQQDNAPAHIAPADERVVVAVQESSMDVALRCQSPNSPDLNVLDLGIFNAMQSRQRKQQTHIIEELVAAVTAAYWQVPP